MRPGFAARKGKRARFFPTKTQPSEDLSVEIMTNALLKRGLSKITISVTTTKPRNDDWEQRMDVRSNAHFISGITQYRIIEESLTFITWI